MFIKQLSVFIENREGRLERVTETLKESNINIVSLSLADTSEYGLLRMIVSDPENAKKTLRDNGFSAMLTDVLAVRLPHQIGNLQHLLSAVAGANLNIEYMYALATSVDNAAIIIKVSDSEKAKAAIENSGLEFLRPEEAYEINN